MRLFSLINATFRHASMEFNIATYAVLPLSPEVGLITWVSGADTLDQMVLENRRVRGLPSFREREIWRGMVDCEFRSLTAAQRLEVFQAVSAQCPGLELFEYMWLKSSNAAIWIRRTAQFTASTALMSIIGYMIGLGDRHPSNIMVVQETGSVVHIDFGDAFESAINRTANPEKVPFRLTRMIVKALTGSVSDGSFLAICTEIMKFVRRYAVLFGGQMTLFVEEPALRVQQRFGPIEGIITRFHAKLRGNDVTEYGDIVSPEQQVTVLIEAAENPANYVRHYLGWGPFW
jgi:phosphatidylinositol kinase/protein kinase (PI-3  family)